MRHHHAQQLQNHEIVFLCPEPFAGCVALRVELNIDDELPIFGGSDEPEMQVIVATVQRLKRLNPIFHVTHLANSPVGGEQEKAGRVKGRPQGAQMPARAVFRAAGGVAAFRGVQGHGQPLKPLLRRLWRSREAAAAGMVVTWETGDPRFRPGRRQDRTAATLATPGGVRRYA